jgi:molybdopterin molybdotransferase
MTLSECTWEQARQAAAHLSTVRPSETIALQRISGRVLAEACVALCDLPSFDSSAMDGWAVRDEGPWQVVGDARAGVPFADELAPGSAVRIATGAVVPSGTSAVLRWEDAELTDGVVNGVITAGADIRRAGEEVRTGDVIAQAGTVVTPALAGFLAATGHDEVAVVHRPRIHLLLLGDELMSEGIPAAGRVRDSLGPQLPGWLLRMGAEVVAEDHIPDELPAVAEAFRSAANTADVVITTGGTAAGPRDHVHAAIAANAGELVVDRVAVRPGHPMLLATLSNDVGSVVPLIGLPGNPHSAIVGLMTLAQPVIDAQLGIPTGDLLQVPTRDGLRTTANHTRLVAGNIVAGAFVLSPYGGSAMLRGLAQSSGFAVVDVNLAPDDLVRWLPLP